MSQRSKISLAVADGDTRTVTTPFDGADHGVASGACPHCKATPFKVAGAGKRIAADDRAYEADGGCLACNRHVGLLRAEVNTLFGVREDEAVGRLGVRIY